MKKLFLLVALAILATSAWSQTRLFLWNDSKYPSTHFHMSLKGGDVFDVNLPDAGIAFLWSLNLPGELSGKAAIEFDAGLMVQMPKGRSWEDLKDMAVVLSSSAFLRPGLTEAGTVSLAESENAKPVLTFPLKKNSIDPAFTLLTFEPSDQLLPIFKQQGKPVSFPKDKYGDPVVGSFYSGIVYFADILPEIFLDQKHGFTIDIISEVKL
jgi:hypothetical protein